HAVVVANGTAALHIAALAAGAAPGVHGVTQPITFVASANGMIYAGATCDLVEIDPDTLMMSPAALAAYLARRPETRLIVPVSFSGLSSDGPALRKAAGDRIIIEDASHAFGAQNADGSNVGGGGWADMTVFSFHPVKPITTGEGGAVVTDDDELARKLRLYRSHGIERDPARLVDRAETASPWYYEQQLLGFNYRLTDLQAALGLAQVAKVDRFMARRREIAHRYDARFAGHPRIRLHQTGKARRDRSGHHLYVVGLDYAALGTTRAQVMSALRAEQIGAQVHYIPVHHQPYHKARLGDCAGRFPVSDAFYAGALSIPCYPQMTDADVDRVADAILRLVD
ncbi:MAG: DegT/DnrJ/EryC1/StrS family aminotransferase, partial [Methylobacteriaceae bacterium]|nr:DegT/DnrJ/EryC1/StrS family aminotransferase [Methylobacteriaceae bacterium]